MSGVVGFMALHYGLPHLPFALRSIIDAVDEMWIAYTPIGSHGHRTDVTCPDSREVLLQAAIDACGDKLRWREGVWPHEGAQRGKIMEWRGDADVILVVDSDEIYPDGLAQAVIDQLRQGSAFRYRLPMIHFYRDFRHAVLNDLAFPHRAYKPGGEGEAVLSGLAPIAHLGYCIRRELMAYKLSIHGHKGEMRWTPEVYTQHVYANPHRWRDVHPTNVDYWTPVLCEPSIYLPGWMQEHPYWRTGAL